MLAKMLNINDLNHFGSDGASTMLSHRSGVATRLKKIKSIYNRKSLYCS